MHPIKNYIYILFASITLLSAHPSLSENLKINDINYDFKDTKSFDKAALNEIIFLPKKGYYNQIELSEDMQRLKKFYFDNGFFDAIIDSTVEYDRENNEVDITFIIFEKEQYVFYKIDYLGMNNLPDEIKSKVYSDQLIASEKPYTRAMVNSEVNRILDILGNNGYIKASIDTTDGKVLEKYQKKFKNYNRLVNLKLTFMGLEKKYYFGSTKINVKDNKYNLEDKYIVRLIQYKEGEVYSKDKVAESEKNLSKLALIQTGRIQADTIIESTGKVNMEVNISLNNKNNTNPYIIATDIDAVFFGGAGVSYTDKYFIKGGSTFTISLEGLFHNKNINRAELKASLFQPYFFTPKYSANYSASLLFFNATEALQYLQLKNQMRVNYTISNNTFYNGAYFDLTIDLQRFRITNLVLPDGSTINFTARAMNSVIGATLVHDNTNDIFNPTKGLYHSLTIENAGALPRLLNLFKTDINYFQYVKLYTPNKFYYDWDKDRGVRIAAAKFSIGDIIEYGLGGNVDSVTSNYKFFSGGGNSLRGWGSRENGILEFPDQGGKFLIDGSLEIRWRTFYDADNFLKNLWTVYFLDYGNVWKDAGSFRFNQIALSAGIGIRYNTFVGPIRIDMGFKLYDPIQPAGKKWLFSRIKETFSKRLFAIHFGLGNAF